MYPSYVSSGDPRVWILTLQCLQGEKRERASERKSVDASEQFVDRDETPTARGVIGGDLNWHPIYLFVRHRFLPFARIETSFRAHPSPPSSSILNAAKRLPSAPPAPPN